MPYGPWDGKGWYSKLRQMTETMQESMNSSNPMLIAVYPLICADMGIDPVGTSEHRNQIFEMVFSGLAFTTKGFRAIFAEVVQLAGCS